MSDPFMRLAERLTIAMVQGLRENSRLSPSFYDSFMPMLDAAKRTKSRILLYNAMQLLLLNSWVIPTLSLSMGTLSLMCDAIAEIDGDEPSEETEFFLFSLLASSFGYSIPCQVLFPQIIPVFLASFGRSTKLPRLLGQFVEIVHASNFNCRMVHDGMLDLVLAKSLCSDVVRLAPDFKFKFAGPKEVCRSLLQRITRIVCDCSVVRAIADPIETPEQAEFLCRLFTIAARFEDRPHFPIGFVPEHFRVSGLFSDDFNGGFALTFELNLDRSMASRYGIGGTLLTVTDANENIFRLFITNCHICAMYQTETRRTSVTVARFPQNCVPTDYLIVFKIIEDKVRIATRQNRVGLSDSDFCLFDFVEGEVKMTVGGSPSNGLIEQHGILAGLTFTPFGHTSPLFSSDVIKCPGKAHEIRIERKPLQYKNSREIVISVLDAISMPAHILETAANSRILEVLAPKFEIPGILSAIKVVFGFSENSQMSCNEVNIILTKLLQAKPYYELYLQFFEVLKVITYPPLRVQWLEELIVNFYLWKRCEPVDLLYILRHWNTVLINSFTFAYEEKRYFSSLSNQFQVFFCSKRSVFSEAYMPEDILRCRDLFANFLVKVGSISIAGPDIAIFFIHLRHFRSKQVLLKLLSILWDLSPFLSASQSCDDLMSLLCGDVDIDESVILNIHGLARETVYPRMIALSELLDSVPLFGRLASDFLKCPNLMPLVTLLALKFNRLDTLAELFGTISTQFYPAVRPNRFWFVFPIVALWNSRSKPVTNFLCKFIHSVMDSGVELPAIVAFISLLRYATATIDSELLTVFLESVRRADQKHEGLADVCFTSAFCHFQENSFHQIILDAVRAEGIEFDCPMPERTAIIKQFSNARSLARLAQINPLIIPINFAYRLDPKSKDRQAGWRDLKMATLALSIQDETSPLTTIFWYFKDPFALSPERYMEISMSIDELIQTKLHDYTEETRGLFVELFDQLRQYVMFLDAAIQLPEAIERSKAIIDDEWKRISGPIREPIRELKQDSTIC
jgi:hypothetical protein